MSPIKYRPEIDGLRAFAVIPVILFHLNIKWIPGGFIGVDVFFVISGFLITSLIIKEYEKNLFTFTNFYLRRIRRIVPILLTIVFLTSIAGFFILFDTDINDLGKQGIASLFSFANIYFWRKKGFYWGVDAENCPLLHSWSLSVEEQFYLLFPFLFIFIIKYYKKWLLSSVIAVNILSFLLFIYGFQYKPIATFYNLPTRAWELGSGCLLSILTYNKNYWLNKIHINSLYKSLLSIIGFVAVILSYIFIRIGDGITPYLIIPVTGSVFIIGFSQDTRNIVYKLLTVPTLVYIGKISYSLYMWHWPILILAKNFYIDGNFGIKPLYTIPFIAAVSIFSYHFIELPIRQKYNIIKPILISYAIIISFSIFLINLNLTQDITIYSNTITKGQLYNVTPNPDWDGFKKKMKGISVFTPDENIKDIYSKGGVIKNYNKDSKYPEVVILGDSHANMWGGVLDEIFKELSISVSFYAADGAQTFFKIPVEKSKGNVCFNSEERYIFDKKRLHFLNIWKPKIVIISIRWSCIKDIETASYLIEYIKKLGSKILFIEQPPELFFGDKNALQFLSYLNLKPIKNKKQYIPMLNSNDYNRGLNFVKHLANKYSHCEFIPIADIFINNDNAWVLDSLDVLYIDDDHLSYKGALKAKSRIKQKLKKYLSSNFGFSNYFKCKSVLVHVSPKNQSWTIIHL